MKDARDYQPRINRRKMRDESVAVLAVTAFIEAIAHITIVSLESRYGETIGLPWDTVRGALVALGSAVALGVLAGERDKDQFDELDTAGQRMRRVAINFLTVLGEKLRDRFATRV